MKKLTAILLALLLACGTMIGCDKETPQNEPAGKETTEQGSKETSPSETEPQMDDVIKDYDQDDSQQGFIIHGKKYNYKGNEAFDEYGAYTAGDVLLLEVKNTTDTNYTAAVTVNLFNEAGEKIGTQKREFEQFIAGYKNYFLINTKDSFASYTCDLTLTEYTGEVVVDKVSFEFVYDNFVSMDVSQGVKNHSEKPKPRFKTSTDSPVPTFDWWSMVVIFDKAGEICVLSDRAGRFFSGTTEDYKDVGWSSFKGKNGTMTPEEFHETYTYICFPQEITMNPFP